MVKPKNMKQRNFWASDALWEEFRRLAEENGLSTAAALRAVMHQYTTDSKLRAAIRKKLEDSPF